MKREYFCDLCTSWLTRYLHHTSHTETLNLVWVLVFWNVQHSTPLQKSPSHSAASCCLHLQSPQSLTCELRIPAQFGSFIKPVFYSLDSSVGIATRYVLNGPGIDFLVGGNEIFRTRPDRVWGPHSLLYYGWRVSLLRVTWTWHGVDHPPSSSAEVKERVQIYKGWNFNSGKYLFTTDTKYVDTCFEVSLSFNVVTSIVYNQLPAMWKS